MKRLTNSQSTNHTIIQCPIQYKACLKFIKYHSTFLQFGWERVTFFAKKTSKNFLEQKCKGWLS